MASTTVSKRMEWNRSNEWCAPGTGTIRGYDNQGGIQASTRTVDNGVWTFGTDADGARATLRIAEDGQSMRAEWVRTDDEAATWRPWMRLRFTRLGTGSDG